MHGELRGRRIRRFWTLCGRSCGFSARRELGARVRCELFPSTTLTPSAFRTVPHGCFAAIQDDITSREAALSLAVFVCAYKSLYVCVIDFACPCLFLISKEIPRRFSACVT